MYGDAAEDAFASMPDLIPIYPAVAGINPWHLEDAIAMALDLVEDVPDVLPARGPRGRGPGHDRPGAALDPPPGRVGAEGQGGRTG